MDNTPAQTPAVYWEETPDIKTEGNLNFLSTVASEDDEYSYHKKKLSRDPLSHRIIEKRRRDRMNNCLADLSRLLPSEYMKKGRGRIEKTEIIEMAIRHMKQLQAHPCTDGGCCGSAQAQRLQNGSDPGGGGEVTQTVKSSPASSSSSSSNGGGDSMPAAEHYKLGFNECLSETMHFLVEVEGYFAGDSLCVQLIAHLNRHRENIINSSGFLKLGGGQNQVSQSQHHQQHQQSSPLLVPEWSSSSSPSCRWSPPVDSSGNPRSGARGGSARGHHQMVLGNGGSVAAAMTTSDDVMLMMMSAKSDDASVGGGCNTASDKESSTTHAGSPPNPGTTSLLTHHNRGGTSPSYFYHQHGGGGKMTAKHHNVDTSCSETSSCHTSTGHNELSPSSQHSDMHHHTALGGGRGGGSTYKFKNNIRKRFADQTGGGDEEDDTGGVMTGVDFEKPRLEGATGGGGPWCRRKSCLPDTTSSGLMPTGVPVPIFALSSTGTYYVPLSLDYSVLASHLRLSPPSPSDMDDSQGGRLVLHPVTISVNFVPPATALSRLLQPTALLDNT